MVGSCCDRTSCVALRACHIREALPCHGAARAPAVRQDHPGAWLATRLAARLLTWKLPRPAAFREPGASLGSLHGLVVLDEIQTLPELFAVLRVLADPRRRAQFLVLGSASPDVVRGASETLAGRVEFMELRIRPGRDRPAGHLSDLVRGGLPRSFLASERRFSVAWREELIRTLLESATSPARDHVPPAAMRRFWTMLAHYHGQTWNAAALGRADGLSHKTVARYLDILTGAFMVPPAPALARERRQAAGQGAQGLPAGTPDCSTACSRSLRHARQLLASSSGASFEGFAIEQVLAALAARKRTSGQPTAAPSSTFSSLRGGAGTESR